MGHSSVLGTEPAELSSQGRDSAALGPSDSSDSGSDLAGIEMLDGVDPTEPVDVALGADRQRSAVAGEGSSDASGTGERRSAGADAGRREAQDISVDRVFSLTGDAEDPIEGIKEVDAAIAADPLSGEAQPEEEDESADPVGDGHSDAEAAAQQKPPVRRRP